MKQVININFHGQVVPIEVSAFDLLKNYTASLSSFFANEEGKEEIINDIESRIGELFQERLKKGATCITDDDVNAIIKSMGRPEEFDGEEPNTTQSQQDKKSNEQFSQFIASKVNKRLYRDENDKVLGGVCSGIANYFGMDPVLVRILFLLIAFAMGTGVLAYIILWVVVPSSASTQIGATRKKLYRDTDDKVLGGVCSGISNYFDISVWIPRVLFLLPFLSVAFRWSHWGLFDFPHFLSFSFSPGALIIYIILWLVVPEAITTSEKLEMKGEKVDLNSIKNSVVEEMKGVQNRAEKIGQEAKTVAQEKGKMMGAEMGAAAKRSGKSLGDIILILIKAFAYFIIGIVTFALVVALFGIAIASIGIFPLKDFLLTNGWQNTYAWGTLLFFIAVPVIGIITWIIRRLTGTKSNGRIITFSFISLWIIGWICFIMMIASISHHFRYINAASEQEITLSNPGVNSIEFIGSDVDMLNHNLKRRWFNAGPWSALGDEDTFYVNNVHFRIVKSTTDSFRLTILKMANGSSRKDADNIASMIDYNIQQTDSIIRTPIGIPINKNTKFRNQRVILTIAVPVGKHIKIDQSIWDNNHPAGKISIMDFNDNWDEQWGNEERGWTTNVEYIMTKDGLIKLDGTPTDNSKDKKHRVRINESGIDVQDENAHVKIDKNGISIDENKQEEIDKKLEMLDDKLEKEKDSLNRILEKKQKLEKEKLIKEASNTNAFTTPVGLPLMNTFM